MKVNYENQSKCSSQGLWIDKDLARNLYFWLESDDAPNYWEGPSDRYNSIGRLHDILECWHKYDMDI